MPKLVKSVNGVVVREYPLNREKLTIGRAASNQIQLEDETVSTVHALIRVEPSVYLEGSSDIWLEDKGSTNGTLLNGRRITRQRLKNGDVIKIGANLLEFVDEGNMGTETTRLLLTDTQD